jgi:hypothetical protein
MADMNAKGREGFAKFKRGQRHENHWYDCAQEDGMERFRDH